MHVPTHAPHQAVNSALLPNLPAILTGIFPGMDTIRAPWHYLGWQLDTIVQVNPNLYISEAVKIEEHGKSSDLHFFIRNSTGTLTE